MAAWTGCFDTSITDAADVATLQCLEPLFKNVVSALLAFAGIALLIMLFIGGFGFLFSGGDQKKLEMARGTITNAIIGLVVIVVAYLILLTIKVFTGIDVTKFTVPIQ